MSDAFAAAVHAFLAGAGSLLASAQFDDLAGERAAADLAGTDRERPNWCRRHALDIEAHFAALHAQGPIRSPTRRRLRQLAFIPSVGAVDPCHCASPAIQSQIRSETVGGFDASPV